MLVYNYPFRNQQIVVIFNEEESLIRLRFHQNSATEFNRIDTK